MIPYKSSLETAVPNSLEVRREILKAMQTLAGDQDERFRERRAEIASIRRGLEQIRQDLEKLGREWPVLVRAELRKYGYNPEEPRVPKHSLGGGEWTRVAANDGPKDASDAPEFPRQPFADGHHWVPKGIYEKRDFSKETKAFFDNAKSGPLADPRVNGYTTEHREYNRAVDQLLDAFLKKNNITEEQMTPAQADDFVQEVKLSSDLRIREFVVKIKRESMKYILRYGPEGRGGDGDEE